MELKSKKILVLGMLVLFGAGVGLGYVIRPPQKAEAQSIQTLTIAYLPQENPERLCLP